MKTRLMERKEIPKGMKFKDVFDNETREHPDKQLIGVEEQEDGTFKMMCDIPMIPVDVAEQCLNQVMLMKTDFFKQQLEDFKKKTKEDLRRLETDMKEITTEDIDNIINENSHLRRIVLLSFLTIGFVIFMFILEVMR